MRKTITSILSLVAIMFATSAMAQETFTYEFESYVGSAYEGYTQTLDEAAIAEAIGCTLAEAKIYAVQSDGTLDEDYQLGGDHDGWRNAEGDWQSWGSDARICVKANFTPEADEETGEKAPHIYYIGGMSGQTGTPATFTATYRIENPADDTKYCLVVVKLTYIPEPEFEITTTIADLEIVGKASLAVEQKPRTNTSRTSYKIQVGDLPTLLGVDADLFAQFWTSKLIYVTQLDEETELKSTELTKLSTSAYFNQLYDEDANPTNELIQGGTSADSRLSVRLASFDGDSITVSVGQTGSLVAPAQYYTTIYIINGNKAFAVNLDFTLIEDETPDLPWDQKTRVGGETITLVSDNVGSYDAQDVDIDINAILALFPEGTAVSDLAFTALTADGLPTTGYTTNTSGFWMDMESHPMNWTTTEKSYYVDYSSAGTLTIGHMPSVFKAEEEAKPTGSLYLVYKNDYYEFVIDYLIGPKEEPDVPDPLLATAEIVAVRSFEMQIVPSDQYQDDYMSQAIDFNLEEIQELIGSTTYRLWGQQWSESRGFYSSQAQQSMSGCSQGYWMDRDTINSCAVVGSWNSKVGNAFGIGISTANPTTFSFFQMPSQRKIGDTYPAVFYFANTDKTKCVQINLLVTYVEVVNMTETVGQQSITVGIHDADDAEEPLTTEFDLTAMFEALGCTQEEFEAAGEWVAKNANGTWSTENYLDPPGGFQFAADGTTVDDGNEVFYAGFNDLLEFCSQIIDEENFDKTYTAQVAARYDGKLYIFNVTVTANTDTAIKSVETTTANAATYDISGRLVQNPTKGLYIQNGKKVLVK